MEQNFSGKNLTNKNFFLSDDVAATAQNMLGKRVGIDYAGEDALLPWRFKLKKSPLN